MTRLIALESYGLLDYMSYIKNVSPQQTLIEEENIASFLEANDSTPLKEKVQLDIKLIDPDDFVKKNECKEVINPIFFIRDGIPTPDGLLSNDIFGLTREERANIYGYIDLCGTFLNPFIYKLWCRMDKSIPNIVHGLKGYKLDSNGYIIEDIENGETGIQFLVKNINKIRIKETDSRDRHNNIEFIMKAIADKKIFIKKMLVQPAFYRDVKSGKGGRTEVGQLNKYYAALLMATRSMRETQDIGLSLGDATAGRIQEILLNIYRCLTGTSNVPEDGVGLAGKMGLISINSLAKTVDYGTRLVLTAPNVRVERLEDMMVDSTHCALPLSSAIINFKPFVVFAIRRFFENEFGGGNTIEVYDKGKLKLATIKDPQLQFSDQVIEEHIKKFIYSFSGRLEPVSVMATDENGKEYQVFARFKGRNILPEQYAKSDIGGESSLINRRLTWCDILFMAANEAVKDKCVLITRYPVDSAYNQIPQKPRISTIKDTEPLYVNNEFYRWYPRIREEDIGKNTSNLFIDTLSISNLLLSLMGADYDGDTVNCKGGWLQETNKELFEFLESKSLYINFSGQNERKPSHQAIQSLYNLTLVLPDDEKKITKVVQF